MTNPLPVEVKRDEKIPDLPPVVEPFMMTLQPGTYTLHTHQRVRINISEKPQFSKALVWHALTRTFAAVGYLFIVMSGMNELFQFEGLYPALISSTLAVVSWGGLSFWLTGRVW